jgi:putative ABC transport system substrate-binding protein
MNGRPGAIHVDQAPAGQASNPALVGYRALSAVTRPSRRQLVQGAVGLGLLAGCGRRPGQGQPQQIAKAPRVGVAIPALAPSAPELDAFRQGLRELGYTEGQNIAVEWRFAEGDLKRLSGQMAELVQLPVDVIVTAGTPGVLAAKQATSTIPILMAAHSAGDPVEEGLVASLARPGGNVTGLTELAPQLIGKRLELLKDAVPEFRRVAVLSTPSVRQRDEVLAAARALDVQVHTLAAHDPDELEAVFEEAAREGVQGLLILSNTFVLAHRARILELAAKSQVPTMSDQRLFVVAGGLAAYGASRTAIWRQAASHLDKILKGAKPADLPIEQPMRFDFVINLKTAQTLGLTIPHHVLLQATEVIQ